jgi:hypothetical protein
MMNDTTTQKPAQPSDGWNRWERKNCDPRFLPMKGSLARFTLAALPPVGSCIYLLFVVTDQMVYGVLRQSGLFQVIGIKTSTSLYWELILFVNDIPRPMETIWSYFQDSCIHAGGSLLLLVTGNGMYKPLGNKRAMLYSADDYNENYGGNRAIYGSCSVPQL